MNHPMDNMTEAERIRYVRKLRLKNKEVINGWIAGVLRRQVLESTAQGRRRKVFGQAGN